MPPTPLRQEDYEAIEAAVMETARGRWFLSEYTRRNRNADTDILLDAIDKLENTLVKERAPSSLLDRVKMDLADMSAAIERTKDEIAQIKHEDSVGTERFERASSELDAIVNQTEQATGDILGAAEQIQEHAWILREEGADNAKCDALDEQATNIYMACSFQDLTGQRIKKIVDAMRYVEKRINSMIDIWGFEEQSLSLKEGDLAKDDARPDAHLLNGPALAGEGVDQTDVDSIISELGDADQSDVDALFGGAADNASLDDIDFDSVVTDSADVPSAEASAADLAEEVDFDAISFDSIEITEAGIDAELDAVGEVEAESDADGVADMFASAETVPDMEPAAVASDDAFVLDDPAEDIASSIMEDDLDMMSAEDVSQTESAPVSEPVASETTALEADVEADVAADMFAPAADEAEEFTPTVSECGIEFVEADELDWADSVSLEDLENADVFATSTSKAEAVEADVEADIFASSEKDAGAVSVAADVFASDPELDDVAAFKEDAALEAQTAQIDAEAPGSEAAFEPEQDLFASSDDRADVFASSEGLEDHLAQEEGLGEAAVSDEVMGMVSTFEDLQDATVKPVVSNPSLDIDAEGDAGAADVIGSVAAKDFQAVEDAMQRHLGLDEAETEEEEPADLQQRFADFS